MHRLKLIALVCLITVGFAENSSTTLMEAKLYVNDARDLNRLGGLAGDLYICSRGADEKGTYLALVTDAEQLARISDCGLETAVTWADLDEKFRLLTGVDPHDASSLQTFGYYFTYWEMRDSLNALATAHPEVCSLFTIGVTSQGRDILCLKISDSASEEEDEPACYFSGATHGDEPMGTSIVMGFLQQILSGYGTDPLSTWLVDNREIYTVPILNPDCSVFCSDSGGAGVYWRKNRRVVVPPNIGVDPSRNHAYKWGYDDIGSSPNPGAHAYRGPYPWSDAEAAAARDLGAAHRFRTEQDFHCFGGYNCYPWGYTYSSPPEQALLQEVVDTFQMYNDYDDTRTGQASQVLYLCNGIQIDWGLSDTAGKFITYAFTSRPTPGSTPAGTTPRSCAGRLTETSRPSSTWPASRVCTSTRWRARSTIRGWATRRAVSTRARPRASGSPSGIGPYTRWTRLTASTRSWCRSTRSLRCRTR